MATSSWDFFLEKIQNFAINWGNMQQSYCPPLGSMEKSCLRKQWKWISQELKKKKLEMFLVGMLDSKSIQVWFTSSDQHCERETAEVSAFMVDNIKELGFPILCISYEGLLFFFFLVGFFSMHFLLYFNFFFFCPFCQRCLWMLFLISNYNLTWFVISFFGAFFFHSMINKIRFKPN